MTHQDPVIVKPLRLLPVDRLIEMIAPLAAPAAVHHASSDQGSAQTGYCFTRLPHTVVLAANAEWFEMARASEAVSCILTTARICRSQESAGKPVIVYDHPAEAFHWLHNLALHEETYPRNDAGAMVPASASVHPSAVIEGAVWLGEGVSVGPGCVITGPAQIGPGTVIEECCTIGSRGLFAKKINGRLTPFRYFGGTRIGANCHIHARTNVARSPHFGCFTTLGDEVAVGISCNIGHDCCIGNGVTLASTSLVCGRGSVGDRAWVGAGAIVSDGVTVGAGARVRIGAVVVQDVPADGDVSSPFARPHAETLRHLLQGVRR